MVASPWSHVWRGDSHRLLGWRSRNGLSTCTLWIVHRVNKANSYIRFVSAVYFVILPCRDLYFSNKLGPSRQAVIQVERPREHGNRNAVGTLVVKLFLFMEHRLGLLLLVLLHDLSLGLSSSHPFLTRRCLGVRVRFRLEFLAAADV